MSPDVAFNSRSFHGQFGKFTGRMGDQPNPTLSFTIDCTAGADAAALAPSYDLLLTTVVGSDVPATNKGKKVDNLAGAEVAAAGSSTTQVVLANGGYTGSVTAGNAVAVEDKTNFPGKYEVGWVQSFTGDTITLTQPLSFTPAQDALVKPSVTYWPMNQAHKSLTFQMWLDATNCITFLGCKGTVKMDAPAPGALPTLTFVFKAMSWQQDSGTRPTTTPDSAVARTSIRFKIGSAAADVKLANWDLQQFVARRRSQSSATGTVAQLVVNRDLRGYLQAYNTDATPTQLTHWKDGTEHELSHQFGNTPFNMVAYQIPKAQRVSVSYGDDNSQTTDQLSFEGNVSSGADELRLAFL